MTQTDGGADTSRSVVLERLLSIADRAHVRPEALLDALEEGLTRVPEAGSASPLSPTERRALEAAGVDLTGPSEEQDPAPWADLLSEILRESLSEDEAAQRLGISAAAVRSRLTRGRLAGVRQGAVSRLPTWQFTGTGVLPHLADILTRAGTLHPLALHRWMTSPDPDLAVGDRELSPAEWLATGGTVGVVLDLVADLPAAS